MKLRSLIRISLLLLVSGASLRAQAYLYLNRKGEVPDRRWKQGEPLELLFSDGDREFWSKAYFEGGDSIGLFHGTHYVLFENIKGVRYNRGLMPLLAQSALGAAGLFTGVFALNGFINGDAPIIRQQQLFVGAGLLALGLALKPFVYVERRMEEDYYFSLILIQD